MGRSHPIRVCVTGAESTGKTTLAARLARYYRTAWVPEFARAYATSKIRDGEPDWEPRELYEVARVQCRLLEQAAEECSDVLVTDTDAFSIWVWHRLYTAEPVEGILELADERPADLYLVSAPDVYFIDDGVRDDTLARPHVHELYVSELERAGRVYVVLDGDFDRRFQDACAAIDGLLAR